MVRKVPQSDGSVVLELVRFDKAWICSECNKEYRLNVPVQCSCGATDKVFLEKSLPIEETARRNYTVNSNFIFEGDEIKKDSIVSMIRKDRVTKGLLSRDLISEIENKQEVTAQKE